MNENLSNEIVCIGADRDTYATQSEERVKKVFPVLGAVHPPFNSRLHRVVEPLFLVDIFAAPGPADAGAIQARCQCAALGINVRKETALHHVDAVRTRLISHGIVPLQFRNAVQRPLAISLGDYLLLQVTERIVWKGVCRCVCLGSGHYRGGSAATRANKQQARHDEWPHFRYRAAE